MLEIKREFEDQSKKEAEFFDKFYKEADEKHRLENYLISEEIIRQITQPTPNSLNHIEYASSLLGNLKGKKLLDYGAGDGWTAICFAKGGARVWAIDISEKGVELIKKKAAANGVNNLVTAEVQNCYKTRFESDKFDIIFGGGVLHHLDIESVGKELNRILHKDGVAVFWEPIRETKIMDIIKKIVFFILNRKPSEETEEESPLSQKRINLLKPYFKIVNIRYFNVLSSAGLLFNSKALNSFLLWVDHFLIKYVPWFKYLGRAVVIELREPVKNSSSERK